MLEHKPFVFLSAIVLVLVVVLALGASRLVGAQTEQPPVSPSATTTTGPNLLNNPYFDNAGYYYRFPGSLVAPGWFGWFVYPSVPEFIDGRGHGECYPKEPDGTCGNRSQGLIRLGGQYMAGVWQPVQITPCLDYQFQSFVRVDGIYHPKVGINPFGWEMPERPGEYECPSGTLCHKMGLGNWSDMPTSTVWSGEVSPPKYEWWGPLSITAEALSTTISVWTYSAPENAGYQTTYWDYAALYQVPRQTPLAPNGLVLAPDLSLNPTVMTGTTTQIQWTTSQPAFSQVFYRLHSTSTVSITSSLTPTAYLPFVVHSGYVSVDDFTYHTEPTSDMATTHSASFSGLEAGTAYDYMVMVRWFGGSTCVSTGSMIGTFTTP